MEYKNAVGKSYRRTLAAVRCGQPFYGLAFLVKDKGSTKRTVNALTVRIILSIVAIVVIIIASATGLLTTNSAPY